MSDGHEPRLEPGEIVVGHISLWRILTNDGDMRDANVVSDGRGGNLDLVTAVGMLAIAQHTILSDPGEEM